MSSSSPSSPLAPHRAQIGDNSNGHRRVRIVHISDTHRRHAEFAAAIPDGDILVHSGDFDSFSLVAQPLLRLTEEREIASIRDFFAAMPHRHRVFVPGNHDMRLHGYWQRRHKPGEELAARLAGSCHVLVDSGVALCGLSFYGIPWCPLRDTSWARGFSKPWDQLLPHWQEAPAGTDVLVTHIPPWEELGAEVCSRIRPKAVLHGHIHGGNGVKWKDGVLVSNAAMDEIPRPVIVDFYLPDDGRAIEDSAAQPAVQNPMQRLHASSRQRKFCRLS